MSRRGASLLLALALALSLFAGCGRNNPEPAMAGDGAFGADVASVVSVQETEEAPEAERTTGSFSMPYNSGYGWNPYTCIGMENRAVMELIYEGLFTLTNEFTAENVLCKECTLSEDGYTFTLALQNAKFSNGKELTASDVVYSIGKAQASPLYSGRFVDVGSCYADGNSTVVIEMLRPNAQLPCLLDFPIIPAYANADGLPAGTGPFVRTDGDALVVNNDWWQGASSLRFQTVNLYQSASAEDTRDSFEIDAVNFIYNNPNASSAATYHSDYELWNSRGTVMQYLAFNSNYGIFQDDGVRAAVTRCIDRMSIAESVYHNFADAAVLPASPASSVYDETLAQKYAFTTARAATEELRKTSSFYLPTAGASPSPSPSPEPDEEDEWEDADEADAEAGETEDGETADSQKDKDDGSSGYNRITMLVKTGNLKRVAAAKAVAEDLGDVGFTVTLKELEEDEFYYNINLNEWDILYGEVTLQPDFDLRPLMATGGTLAYGGFGGAGELDNLMAKARENSGNYYDLFEHIMDNGYLCPVLFINNAVFTTRGVFTGLDPSPDNLFYHITDIQVNHD